MIIVNTYIYCCTSQNLILNLVGQDSNNTTGVDKKCLWLTITCLFNLDRIFDMLCPELELLRSFRYLEFFNSKTRTYGSGSTLHSNTHTRTYIKLKYWGTKININPFFCESKGIQASFNKAKIASKVLSN